MHDYLSHILTAKKQEIAAIKTKGINKTVRVSSRSFKAALKTKGLSIIAEIKRRSPSKQHLATIPDPGRLAKQYIQGGAAAISVLTEKTGFGGSLEDLQQVVTATEKTNTPILRKDFILDELQICESINAGADAILLIVAILGEKTKQLLTFAKKLNIDALVEVHNLKELQYAVSIDAEIIGINNRNLTTFEVDTTIASALYPQLPKHVISVAESGISSHEQIQAYAKQGFDAALVGELLVRSDDPSQQIGRLR